MLIADRLRGEAGGIRSDLRQPGGILHRMERILLIFVVQNLKIRQYLLQSPLAVDRLCSDKSVILREGVINILRAVFILFRDEYAVDLLAGRIQEGQG